MNIQRFIKVTISIETPRNNRKLIVILSVAVLAFIGTVIIIIVIKKRQLKNKLIKMPN